MSSRAGRYEVQPEGYKAFVPAPLPPVPPLHMDDELVSLNSRSDSMIARLDAAGDLVPNRELFVFMHAMREAVLSSQIEGTQSSLEDLLRVEADLADKADPDDVTETVNYQKALAHGLKNLEDMSVSLKLVTQIHKVLMQGARGQDKQPGEFRRKQNWIGAPGTTIGAAVYVPPPPIAMMKALGEWESFVKSKTPMAPLIKSALIHGQFQTIHPFLDGNGRVGRLLIPLILIESGVIKHHLLYPSLYFKRHRGTYYDLLQRVRDRGEWEPWVKFFVLGLAESAEDGYHRTLLVTRLRDDHRGLLESKRASSKTVQVFEGLFRHPYVTIKGLAEQNDVSFPTASSIVGSLVSLGILVEKTGKRRDRAFGYKAYLDVLGRESVLDGP
ncbi:MAG: Fic family protein [Chthonomonadaceae bacterium]|nr:Fic family protein [Chthonomonadaceae bacterium]